MIKIIKDDKAQAGGIIMFVFSFFIIGFLYIVLGGIEDRYVSQNNLMIAQGILPYSSDHYNAMSAIFAYWWAIPVVSVILLIIYAIKNALEQKTGEAY